MLVSFGVVIMDMFPSEKGVKLTDVKNFIPTPGGAAANVAVAAQRLGVKSAFMGKVGDEQFGRYLHDVLYAEGIDTRGMIFDKRIRTTLNFHAIRPDGAVEYLFYRNPGADMSITPGELHQDLLKEAEVFHFDSLSITDEPCRSAVDEAMRRCKRSGALISFDVNYRDVLWPNVKEAKDRIVEYAVRSDIVKFNETELELFPPGDNLVQNLLNAGTKLVLVTLGGKGVYYVHGDMSGTLAGFKTAAVDTIGCGDSFIAGFLTCVIKEKRLDAAYSADELERYCRFANAAAALTATKHGCIPAMPRLESVLDLLRRS